MELPNFTNPLLRRAFMYVEDGVWKEADALLEQVLNQEPENAYAYLGKLFVKLKVKNCAGLEKQTEPFDNSAEYKKCIKFCDTEFLLYLENVVNKIKYNIALKIYNSAGNNVSEYKKAGKLFNQISNYLDAANKEKICNEKSDMLSKKQKNRKEKISLIIILLAIGIYSFYTFCFNNLKAGDIVYMGREKAGVGTLSEPIEWIVLDVRGKYKLLLSKYCLGKNGMISGYHKIPNVIISWDISSIRSYLNNTIFEEIFDQNEKRQICTAESMDINGIKSEDKLFLLNEEEVKKYLPNENNRLGTHNPKTGNIGSINKKMPVVNWWLRDVKNKIYVSYVSEKGDIKSMAYCWFNERKRMRRNYDPNDLLDQLTEIQEYMWELEHPEEEGWNLIRCGVRPAMWVKM